MNSSAAPLRWLSSVFVVGGALVLAPLATAASSPAVTWTSPSTSMFQLPATSSTPLVPSLWSGANDAALAGQATGYGVPQSRLAPNSSSASGPATASPAADAEVCELAAGVGRTGSVYKQITSTAVLSCAGDLATGPIEIEVCTQISVPSTWTNVACHISHPSGGSGDFTRKAGPYDTGCSNNREYRTWAWDDIPELSPPTAVAISGDTYC